MSNGPWSGFNAVDETHALDQFHGAALERRQNRCIEQNHRLEQLRSRCCRQRGEKAAKRMADGDYGLLIAAGDRVEHFIH